MPEQPLRVLLALAQSTGGIGRHVRSLARGLPERGVEVTVCAPADTIAALDLQAPDVAVIAAPLGVASPAAVLAARRKLRTASASTDLVHAHGLRAGADCAAFAGDRPLVVTWHNAPQGGWLGRVARAGLERYVAHAADLTLGASEDLAAAARAAGATVVRTALIAAPVLAPAQRSAAAIRAELALGDRPVVLAIGRLQRQKRLDVLVAAAAPWAGDDTKPAVLIAGDGPDHAALAAQIDASGAPVHLLGSRTDIAELLAAADVVALPSEWEARSLVAQEAMRAGVPLITTPVGGLPSLVGEAAVTVAVGDSDALRAAIETVLSDRGRRERMVAVGLARARTWPDEQQSIDELAKTYFNLNRRVRPGSG